MYKCLTNIPIWNINLTLLNLKNGKERTTKRKT